MTEGEPTTTHEADAVRYIHPDEVPVWSAPDYHAEMARGVLAASERAWPRLAGRAGEIAQNRAGRERS